MIEKRMQDEINKQINEELFSAYLYQSMSAYFEDLNLKGFASWFTVQSGEEMIHANKFYTFLVSRGGRVEFEAIEKPQKEWASPLAAFEAALEHEKHITARINEMMDVAEEVKDRPTISALQWFIDEQVEEEASVDEYVQLLKMIGNENKGIFMVDRELAGRGTTAAGGAE
ncbi:MAG TPA: ferritin [Thermotogota bacterium]|nr:ferritin [Thermotogota bacterium]HPJ89437.1 ferritin [Thermotogota bacterium]HPR95262.1 ferritin [Thermotogota bacterium]